MGITVADIENWLSQTILIDIVEILADYEETIKLKIRNSAFKKLTTIPLPHFVDVKVRLPSRILSLMHDSDEDKIFTEHVCNFHYSNWL